MQLVSFVVLASSDALACPEGASLVLASTTEAVAVDAVAATHSARSAGLVGSNCSYTTGMMARRVVEEGQDWAWDGFLAETANDLSTAVAAPFDADGGAHVIANELVEVLSIGGLIRSKLSLRGKLLEVDGVRYVVVTSYKVLHS